jgi:hypothetical protein
VSCFIEVTSPPQGGGSWSSAWSWKALVRVRVMIWLSCCTASQGTQLACPLDMVQGGGWGESVTNPFGLGGLWGTGGRWVHHEFLVIRNTRYA